MAKTLQNHPEYAKANNVNEEFGDMAISKDFKMNSEIILVLFGRNTLSQVSISIVQPKRNWPGPLVKL